MSLQGVIADLIWVSKRHQVRWNFLCCLLHW